jgi:SAM-dependent methyltransferase
MGARVDRVECPWASKGGTVHQTDSMLNISRPAHAGFIETLESERLCAYQFVDSLPAWNDAPPVMQRLRRSAREVLAAAWVARHQGARVQVLEAGSGRGPGVAGQLSYLAPDLAESIVVDRIDIVDPTLTHPMIRHCWQCSVEGMPMVPSGNYDFVVAQWLLEHVEDVETATREFARVLCPGGRLCAAVPNPAAPEFLFARLAPYKLHRLLVSGDAAPTPTYYAFHSIDELVSVLRRAGLETVVDDRVPCVGRYLGSEGSLLGRARLGLLGRSYDRLLLRHGLRRLMGDVFLVAERPAGAAGGQP